MSKKTKNNKKSEVFLYNDHSKPKTRRDFLSQGIVGLATYALMPNLSTLLAKTNDSFAQQIGCVSPTFTSGLPYLCIDGAGGMNIPGSNAMVGFENGGSHQEAYTPIGYSLGDYIKLGLPPSMHPSKQGMTNGEYGLVFHSRSGILEGIQEELAGVKVEGRAIQEMIDGLIICTRTADDTNSNPSNTTYMANKLGANGKLVSIVGNNNNYSGGNSVAPVDQIVARKKPSVVRSYTDGEALISLGAKLMGKGHLDVGTSGGEERAKKFMTRIKMMSESKLKTFSNLNSYQQIQSIVGCSQAEAKDLFVKFNASLLNPLKNDVQSKQLDTAFKGADQRVGSIANLVLENIAGSGTIVVGGCDYHNGTAMSGHNKDKEVGRYIGKCIHLASLKGKNLFIHLFTDGGVVGDAGGTTDNSGKVIWSSDSSTRSSALMIVYKHNHDGSSLVIEDSNGPKRQIGNFIKGGGVELSATSASNNSANLWKAVMLNYMAAQGKTVEDFKKVFGRASLPPDYKKLIRFKKIV